jgi:hypothetical protein
MNKLSPELTRQVLEPAMHQKLLLRAAELVALGWTRGTAARDATGQKVRSTAPQATAWCVVGAVDRALYELWNLDVYALLGLEVDAYDTAPCPLAVLRALRRPLQRVLGCRGLAQWNDHACPGPAAAEQLLGEAAGGIDLERQVDRETDPDREGRTPRDGALSEMARLRAGPPSCV